jgi:hypothetical protein
MRENVGGSLARKISPARIRMACGRRAVSQAKPPLAKSDLEHVLYLIVDDSANTQQGIAEVGWHEAPSYEARAKRPATKHAHNSQASGL